MELGESVGSCNDRATEADYPSNLGAIRQAEYSALAGLKSIFITIFSEPSLEAVTNRTPSTDGVYLDHAGTALCAKSLIDRFSTDITTTIYGNPHSAAESSQRTARRIDSIRTKALQFFNADPGLFDLVFVPNATAGAKLVGEALRETGSGFRYAYQEKSHTSLVGLRELATLGHRCFDSLEVANGWLSGVSDHDDGSSAQDAKAGCTLTCYPAQSNMDGSRLPLNWCQSVREQPSSLGVRHFSLLDAAALVSTSPLDLGDEATAPDFTILSFYKIFGFPDLGALIIRKATKNIFKSRKYFGGGTVDVVSCQEEQWHISKGGALHDRLEDGTLPFHQIIALGHAIDVHREIYGSMSNVSGHVTRLSVTAYTSLQSLRHSNGRPVCRLYKDNDSIYGNDTTQGPIICFNLLNSQGAWVSNTEVEKLANIKNISLRTGGLCNPGGIALHLKLSPWHLRENFSAGHRCGNEMDIVNGRPTGAIRISFGAMSNMEDVDKFLAFIKEYFQSTSITISPLDRAPIKVDPTTKAYRVERLAIFPIKSCGAWPIPKETSWTIRPEGLEWDREWALLHLGTGRILSQKLYPKMALIKPSIDLTGGVLKVRFTGFPPHPSLNNSELKIPLSADPFYLKDPRHNSPHSSEVCGEAVQTQIYTDALIERFFTAALDVPCTLVRFPSSQPGPSTSRLSKACLQPHQFLNSSSSSVPSPARPILLSNESPILTISRSSLNRLNKQIKASGGKAAEPDVFRANIIVAEDYALRPGDEQPYLEDSWRYLKIGHQYFQALGACRRCQMVCVDQQTAVKDREPFLTLAKTRRFDGKVWFGQHMAHLRTERPQSVEEQNPVIRVGDEVRSFLEGEELDEELNGLLDLESIKSST
ncbi:MAG: hypothetical protein M1814_004574 [Vezdaea aestivalis]|nr:MAG: hypothetical protein M1814_004574 [Vezdaea aestivalis]